MRIDTVSDFSKLIADAKALCAENGVSVKAKTLKPVLAETFGYPHENALIAALPVESDLDASELAERFAKLLAERVKPPLSATQAEPLFESPCIVRVVWSPNPTDKVPLFKHYDGQLQPQPAFLSLDIRTGEVDADYSGEIGNAVPSDVWRGLVRRYSVPAGLLSSALESLLSDANFLALLNRVLVGSEEHWDGSNYVARLSEDAQDAEDEIERYLADSIDHADDCGTVVSLLEHFSQWDHSIEEIVGDAWDLAARATEIREEAWSEHKIMIDADADEFIDYLENRAAEPREDFDLDALLEANAKKSAPIIFAVTTHYGREEAWAHRCVWDAVDAIRESRYDDPNVDIYDLPFPDVIEQGVSGSSSHRIYYSPDEALEEVLKEEGEIDLEYPPRIVQAMDDKWLLTYQHTNAAGELIGTTFDDFDTAREWAEQEGAHGVAMFVADKPERIYATWINPDCDPTA